MSDGLPNNSSKRVRQYDFVNPLIGHRLKILRLEKKISRSRAAKIIGKTLKQLDALEDGRKSLTAENIYKLCNFFSVDAGYFFVDLTEIATNGGELKINAHQAKEVRRLIESYLDLPNRDMQKTLVQLAESVATSDM